MPSICAECKHVRGFLNKKCHAKARKVYKSFITGLFSYEGVEETRIKNAEGKCKDFQRLLPPGVVCDSERLPPAPKRPEMTSSPNASIAAAMKPQEKPPCRT